MSSFPVCSLFSSLKSHNLQHQTKIRKEVLSNEFVFYIQDHKRNTKPCQVSEGPEVRDK